MTEYPSQPAYNAPSQPPPNHLAWAILSTIFCCLPLGIVSIVFAAQVNDKWHAGDVAGAQEASGKARQFALWGTIIGAVLIVAVIAIYVVVIAIAISTGSSTSTSYSY
ncbi:CD225/dispanin family protein [Aeromicrobium sp. CTD01-1L150]|uniref:CD225/dispanin family protein n=1 Tax=Aeromicrobium sp. CTD01-1L150 TaxID=3341830 RepID=UPI0035C0F6E4